MSLINDEQGLILYIRIRVNSLKFFHFWASLVAQLVKNPPTMQETWVRPLVGKIP